MKRSVAFGLVAVVLFSATGCGSPDALMRELLVHLNAWVETIEKKESADRQLAAMERVKTTVEKIDKLKLSAEDKDKLIQKYEPELKKWKERHDAALKKLIMEGGGAVPLDPLGGFLK